MNEEAFLYQPWTFIGAPQLYVNLNQSFVLFLQL